MISVNDNWRDFYFEVNTVKRNYKIFFLFFFFLDRFMQNENNATYELLNIKQLRA